MTTTETLVRPAPEAQTREPSKLMKAILCPRYGPPDVLQLKEVEKPVPVEGRVLVKIHAASANPADYHPMRGAFMIRVIARSGLRRPKDPKFGTDIAGRVEAIGNNVTRFQPGDEVFGVCPGAFAEYGSAREDRLALKPANISFEQAAAIPIAALTALQGLRDKGHIKSGQKVLVNGAGGGVGTFAVQIAKSFGTEVTGVTSTQNLDMVRSIGADRVIDYTKEDFTRTGERYDLICDIAAMHSISDYKRALNPNGTCVIVGFRDKIIRRLLYFAIRGRLFSRGDKKVVFFIAKITPNDLVFMKELIEAGKVVPVVDRRYPLSETAQAIRYLEEGHARGKVIITIDHSSHA
jgi:NADPH:quinone reductase-like Zn-dependent oxidoreductase